MSICKALYKLQPFVSPKPWGYEDWAVSTIDGCESFLEESKKPVSVSEKTSHTLPVLVKIIQANQMLSVQVHPDEEYARLHENSHGKTECWYILDADEEATVISGLQSSYTKEKFCEALQNNNLDDFLIYTKVKKGDFVFIPAGTVHAIMGGIRILEIQQASNITYRIFDWGRGRPLHLNQALDVMKPTSAQHKTNFTGKFECAEFGIEKIEPRGETVNMQGRNCWASFIVLDGNGTIESSDEKYNAAKEDVFLAAPNAEVKISGDLQVMQVWY